MRELQPLGCRETDRSDRGTTGTQLARASSLEAIIECFSALTVGVLAVVSFIYADACIYSDAWLLVLGAMVLAATTAVCAVRRTVALRRDRVTPEHFAEA